MSWPGTGTGLDPEEGHLEVAWAFRGNATDNYRCISARGWGKCVSSAGMLRPPEGALNCLVLAAPVVR